MEQSDIRCACGSDLARNRSREESLAVDEGEIVDFPGLEALKGNPRLYVRRGDLDQPVNGYGQARAHAIARCFSRTPWTSTAPALAIILLYRRTYCATIRSREKLSLTYWRTAAGGIAPAPCSCRTRSTNSSAVRQMKPLTPSCTTSSTAPPGNAITGVPQAIASSMTNPNGSSH